MAGSPSYQWREFSSRDALAKALSEHAGQVLRDGILERSAASLAVSGGSTPKLLFERLSQADLPWDAVTITLCDERFVSPTSSRSNEALVRDYLLQGRAAEARFLPLFADIASVEEAALSADDAVGALPLPLDMAVLGMGEDGHTLSFFPDAVELEAALDPASETRVIAIHAPSAGEPRLTLTLPLISEARNVVLHIEGAAKRAAFERAMTGPERLPIRRVLESVARPPIVFWAP